LTLADGSKIKNVVASYAFKIKNVQFVEKNVSVKNGTYAGGLAVKPDVLVQIKGQTLVEGKDYELKFYTGQYGKTSYKEFLIVLMLQMEKRMVSLLMVKVDTQVHLFISMQLGELTKKISKTVMLKSLMVLQLL
jgi:hypothetical protein